MWPFKKKEKEPKEVQLIEAASAVIEPPPKEVVVYQHYYEEDIRYGGYIDLITAGWLIKGVVYGFLRQVVDKTAWEDPTGWFQLREYGGHFTLYFKKALGRSLNTIIYNIRRYERAINDKGRDTEA